MGSDGLGCLSINQSFSQSISELQPHSFIYRCPPPTITTTAPNPRSPPSYLPYLSLFCLYCFVFLFSFSFSFIIHCAFPPPAFRRRSKLLVFLVSSYSIHFWLSFPSRLILILRSSSSSSCIALIISVSVRQTAQKPASSVIVVKASPIGHPFRFTPLRAPAGSNQRSVNQPVYLRPTITNSSTAIKKARKQPIDPLSHTLPPTSSSCFLP